MPKVKITSSPKLKVKVKAANGLQLLGEGDIKPLSNNMFDGGSSVFTGPSHADGGIPIKYGDQLAEVEGSEPFFRSADGSLQIFGKMKVPNSGGKTFKAVAKDIAGEEDKASKLLDKSVQLINTKDPFNKYEKYSFNSGVVMAKYAQSRQADLANKKEQLASLQNLMLSDKENTNRAKNGKTLKYANGGDLNDPPTKSLAQRHNNPGNIKYAKWLEKYGATKGEAAKDGGHFAVFPSLQAGQQAIMDLLDKPMYKNKTVKEAIKTWTGGGTYQNIPLEIKNQVVGKLDAFGKRRLLDTITMGEDSKRYNWEGVTSTPTGYNLPPVEVSAPRIKQPVSVPDVFGNPNDATPPEITPFINTPAISSTPNTTSSITPLGDIGIPNKRRLPSLADQNRLSFGQIAPELLTLATERRQFVPGQRYTPDLYTPYQVSFQDQLNQNQATFNDLVRRSGNNPTSLGALAAQKYNADSQVLANEFRTNQDISNQITNQNTSLLNQAQLTNLELQDRQMVRQTQADANTRANIRNAVSSISGKILQNRAENNTIRLYENMFNYRPDQDLQLEYVGPDPVFTGGTSAPINNQTSRAVYDKNGNLVRTTVTTPSQLKTSQDQYRVAEQQRKNRLRFF